MLESTLKDLYKQKRRAQKMSNELIGKMEKVGEADGYGPVFAGTVKLDNDNTTRIYFTPFGTVGVREIFGRED